MRKYRVIAGPYRLARRFAERRGWTEEEYLIVTRGHQLARLDPALITAIFVLKLNVLGQRVKQEIREEIARVRTLWPVPVAAAG